MSAFTDISAALDSHTNDLSLPTAWENSGYEPTIGTLYIRPTILPANTFQAGLGASGLDDNFGIYQIDIFSEAGKGKGAAIIKADVIANAFKRGTVLTYNGVSVRLGNVSRGSGSRDGAWFVLPVFINYQSFTQAR
jgi:hypothetical protein